MSPTIHLESPIDGHESLECNELQLVRDLAIAHGSELGDRLVVPLGNVTGIASEAVAHEVDEIEFSGGRMTEVVTTIG